MSEEARTIVIDNGSSMMKVGFSEDEAPLSVFPSVVGHKKYETPGSDKNAYVGDEVCAKANLFSLNYPIKHGNVENWNDMEKIWKYIFYNELRVEPAEHTVVLSKPVNNPKVNNEKMTQIMFETFNVPSFYLGTQSAFSIYASGRTTGIACDIGGGLCQFVPIYEGNVVINAANRQNIGGQDIDEYLKRILTERGYYFDTFYEKELVRQIKEEYAYVALDYHQELYKSNSSSEFEIPNITLREKPIKIANELFRCTELLFKPILNGFEFEGLEKLLYDSIIKCEDDIQKDLFCNIVLSGSSTMFKGLSERIEKEIICLNSNPSQKIKVVAEDGRNYLSWNGGSILASLPTFPPMTIKKDEYKEAGPGIVNRKCV